MDDKTKKIANELAELLKDQIFNDSEDVLYDVATSLGKEKCTRLRESMTLDRAELIRDDVESFVIERLRATFERCVASAVEGILENGYVEDEDEEVVVLSNFVYCATLWVGGWTWDKKSRRSGCSSPSMR